MTDNFLDPVKSLIGDSIAASSTTGEMFFLHPYSAGPNLTMETLAPWKLLYSGVLGLFKGLKNLFKDKKQLISIGIITMLWIVLSILPILGISSPVLSILNFFTFAQGGVSSKISGMIGGTIGKGVFAYFVFSIILPLLSGKKPFTGFGRSLKKLFSGFLIRNPSQIGILLLGVGTGLMLYRFLSGNGSLENAMVGIAAFFVSVRALQSQAGFLWGFMTSFINKYFKRLSKDIAAVQRLIAGYSSGFAFGVVLSFIGVGSISHLVGFLLMIIAMILMALSRNKKAGAIS